MYSQFLRIWQEYILNEPCIVGKAKNALKAWEKIDKILEKYWLNLKKKIEFYSVSDLPIGSTGWRLGPQNLGAQGL
jgi:hypothetical protein